MASIGLAKWFELKQEGKNTKVNCGTCSACCRGHYAVSLTDEEKTRLKTDEDGTLARNEDGDCYYLVDEKCSIYKTRPLVCRKYDCRMFSAVTIFPIKQDGAISDHGMASIKRAHTLEVKSEKDYEILAKAVMLKHIYSQNSEYSAERIAEMVVHNIATADLDQNKLKEVVSVLKEVRAKIALGLYKDPMKACLD